MKKKTFTLAKNCLAPPVQLCIKQISFAKKLSYSAQYNSEKQKRNHVSRETLTNFNTGIKKQLHSLKKIPQKHSNMQSQYLLPNCNFFFTAYKPALTLLNAFILK